MCAIGARSLPAIGAATERRTLMTSSHTAAELLRQAADIVDGRDDVHGTERVSPLIAEYWSAHLGMPVDEQDVSAMMVLLKVARLRHNSQHMDSWLDIAGYAGLGAESVGSDRQDATRHEGASPVEWSGRPRGKLDVGLNSRGMPVDMVVTDGEPSDEGAIRTTGVIRLEDDGQREEASSE